MSRTPWLDRVVGGDRLAVWHRWAGFACLWLLVGHALFTTVGFGLSDGSGVVAEIGTLLFSYPWVLMATVGLALLIAVAVSSIRAARRRLSYETWYGIHLYAYLGIALAFLHEIVVGTDFVNDPVAVGYWIALYAVSCGLLLTYRVFQPMLFSVRHRLRVERVVQEAPGVVSIHLIGERMAELPIRAGQYFQLRFLSGGGWWRHHPFSISAAPNGLSLRITVKDLGDDTHRLATLQPGTRVFAEGPYGAFTRERMRGSRALFIAGGIGITPIRAMIEERQPFQRDLMLLYRTSSWDDVVFGQELEALGRVPGTSVRFLVGRRGSPRCPSIPSMPSGCCTSCPTSASATSSSAAQARSWTTSLRASGRSISQEGRSMQNVSRRPLTLDRQPSRIPRRGAAAAIGTVAGVALLISFRTPDASPLSGLGGDSGLGLGTLSGLGSDPRRPIRRATWWSRWAPRRRPHRRGRRLRPSTPRPAARRRRRPRPLRRPIPRRPPRHPRRPRRPNKSWTARSSTPGTARSRWR